MPDPNQNQIDPSTLDEAALENMTLDQLRALDQQQAAQPRDERGRFAKVDDTPVDDPAVADPQDDPADDPSGEPDQVIYERHIDLGDGSGVQVFRADSLEELVDKLAEAQRNATRKIRELNQAVKQNQQPTSKEHQFTEDEEFLISQQLMSEPSAAFKKLFKETTGLDISEFKTKLERVSAFEKAQAENQAAQQFIQTHPDYAVTPANGERLVNYLQTYQLEVTPENLERAYNDLNRSGLLEGKAPEAPVASATPVAPAPRAPQRRSSGISARRAPVIPPKPQYTQEDLESMTSQQLLELDMKMRQQRQQEE